MAWMTIHPPRRASDPIAVPPVGSIYERSDWLLQNLPSRLMHPADCSVCLARVRWSYLLPTIPFCQRCIIDPTNKGAAFDTPSGAAMDECFDDLAGWDADSVDEDPSAWRPVHHKPMHRLSKEQVAMRRGHFTRKLIALHEKLEAQRRAA